MWKPIDIEGLISKENSTDLIGIEVCDDFNENNSISSKKAKKRKSQQSSSDSNSKKKIKLINRDKKNNAESTILTPSLQGSTNEKTTVDVPEIDSIWNSFGLPNHIIRALLEKGYKQPTQIQSLTLPAAILGKKNIVGAAETGSGKTLAFGLPILNGILQLKENKSKTYKSLYALILTPTRELAVQVRNHLIDVAKYTGIHVAVIVGGMAAVKQERILSKGPEIVVATPGRLWELIESGHQHLRDISDIKFLAIDETDRMLERQHFEELNNLIDKINSDEDKKQARQNFVFSATLTLVHELPKYIKKSKQMNPEIKLKQIIERLGLTDPKVVDITQGIGTSSTLTECKISCGIDEKDHYVYYFLKRHEGRTLIFCNTIGCVKRLTNLLGLLNCGPLPLHASMQQRQRLKNLERFRDVPNSILIATDVAARGLDIPGVEHVIHYQTPRTSESYVHRSGRTARSSNEGITIVLIEPSEAQNYIKLCKTLKKTDDLPDFPAEQSFLNCIKERVNLAREVDRLQLQVKKVKSESGFFKKAAKEMDIILDDRYNQQYDTDDIQIQKKVYDKKKKQLFALLAKPIVTKNFSGKYPLFIEELRKNSNIIDDKTKAIEVVNLSLKQKNKNKVPTFKISKKKVRSKQ